MSPRLLSFAFADGRGFRGYWYRYGHAVNLRRVLSKGGGR
jgi:hypothetical protein